jgi:hypothetical protein
MGHAFCGSIALETNPREQVGTRYVTNQSEGHAKKTFMRTPNILTFKWCMGFTPWPPRTVCRPLDEDDLLCPQTLSR